LTGLVAKQEARFQLDCAGGLEPYYPNTSFCESVFKVLYEHVDLGIDLLPISLSLLLSNRNFSAPGSALAMSSVLQHSIALVLPDMVIDTITIGGCQ